MNRSYPARGKSAFSLMELVVVLAIIGVLAGLLLPAIQKVRERSLRTDCENHLRQLVLGLHHYHDAHSILPAGLALAGSPDGMPFSGWELHLLPFVEQTALWRQALEDYRAKRSLGGPPPHRGLSVVVPLLTCPADPRIQTPQYSPRDELTVALTSFLGVCGQNCLKNDGVLYRDSRTKFTDVTDGLSNTLFLGERPPGFDFRYGWWYGGRGQPWSNAGDTMLGVRAPNLEVIVPGSPCGPGFYSFGPSRFDDPCGAFHFWSPHPGGANFAFGDGAVRFVSYGARDALPALATRAGVSQLRSWTDRTRLGFPHDGFPRAGWIRMISKLLFTLGFGMLALATYVTYGDRLIPSPSPESIGPAVAVAKTEWYFPDFPAGEKQDFILTFCNSAPVALEVLGLTPT